MTKTVVAFTLDPNSERAGAALGERIALSPVGRRPDALVVFASSRYDHAALLRALTDVCQPAALVGASSAGEFAGASIADGAACALALCSDEMRFCAALGNGVREASDRAAQDIVASFKGLQSYAYPYRAALVMTDTLACDPEELIRHLVERTRGTYRFFGGGAADEGKFRKTQVFHGTDVMSDAAVALEILSPKPIGVGVAHGWEPASPGMRVTEARGDRLISLNGVPAVQAFMEHAEATGQRVDTADPLHFLLRNVLGIATEAGFRLRVPVFMHEDKSITCAAAVPAGCIVHIMRTPEGGAACAAATATQRALQSLGAERPQLALFFDCVATRLRLGDLFALEPKSVTAELGGAALIGCNTYGQVAHASGQLGGFHNCTAVVCVLPS